MSFRTKHEEESNYFKDFSIVPHFEMTVIKHQINEYNKNYKAI